MLQDRFEIRRNFILHDVNRNNFAFKLIMFGASKPELFMLNDIKAAFGLNVEDYHINSFGDGLINHTWKVEHNSSDEAYILQQINKNVFKNPLEIAENTRKLASYLSVHHPDYLFVAPLPTTKKANILAYNGEYYRLMPFVKNSVTINTVESNLQAFEAARQFGRFSRLLAGFDTAELNDTIPDFHNLSLRYAELELAIKNASPERIKNAEMPLQQAQLNRDIVTEYERIVSEQLIPLRVMHHDTKISNVLFNQYHKGLCVIDLDTVMPGYFISDVGDMMRTYLSPYNEEEPDFSKITIREDFFSAIAEGYLKEMGDHLTTREKQLFYYAGRFMIYMQAIRFLTDYLNNDVYYKVSTPMHNLSRSINQFTLLKLYQYQEVKFKQVLKQIFT